MSLPNDFHPAPTLNRRSLLALPLAASLPAAQAQFRVEISGVGETQIPIAIGTFRGEPGTPQPISAIIRADLERSGLFRNLDTAGVALDESSQPAMDGWRSKGADALVGGSITKLADGRFDVRYRLWDVVKGVDAGGASYAVVTGDLRLVAHQIADAIYEKLTGEKGVFATRIAYVTKGGGRYQLWVADADGEGAQSALTSREPIISPAWSPDGRELAYVSFEKRKAVVYVQSIASGQRRAVANFKGSNSAPTWSPDGQSLVVTLTLGGVSQLYRIPAKGEAEPRRLTNGIAIDTEAHWTADGSLLYFVSDRGGSPQIYRMAAGGGNPERLTFSGSYNISPSVSPDGKLLAYVAREDSGFRLKLTDLLTNSTRDLSSNGADESPSFAPNGRLLIYATREGGRDLLMTTTLDGRVKGRLAISQLDVREPVWGPFRR